MPSAIAELRAFAESMPQARGSNAPVRVEIPDQGVAKAIEKLEKVIDGLKIPESKDYKQQIGALITAILSLKLEAKQSVDMSEMVEAQRETTRAILGLIKAVRREKTLVYDDNGNVTGLK